MMNSRESGNEISVSAEEFYFMRVVIHYICKYKDLLKV
jgi:hypothetical protein